MPEIAVKKGEPIDRALKRLKTKIETEGTLEEFRRRRQHETLTQRKKRKAKSAAKKKNQKYRFVP
jgi:small subunit ribosomal protein S21